MAISFAGIFICLVLFLIFSIFRGKLLFEISSFLAAAGSILILQYPLSLRPAQLLGETLSSSSPFLNMPILGDFVLFLLLSSLIAIQSLKTLHTYYS